MLCCCVRSMSLCCQSKWRVEEKPWQYSRIQCMQRDSHTLYLDWWHKCSIQNYSLIFFVLLLILFPLLFIFRKQKGEKITIWERNFQLAFYSILLLCSVLFYESAYTESDPGSMLFFNGWTVNTVLIALIQAVRYALVLTFVRVIVAL